MYKCMYEINIAIQLYLYFIMSVEKSRDKEQKEYINSLQVFANNIKKKIDKN